MSKISSYATEYRTELKVAAYSIFVYVCIGLAFTARVYFG